MTDSILTNQWIMHADTHDLPQEEVLRESGGTQGYPPKLIGDTTVENLMEIDNRCRHFSWLVLETERLGHEGWMSKYGSAFHNRRNAAFAFYSRVHFQYDLLKNQGAVPGTRNGEELQRRFFTYFLDATSPFHCNADEKQLTCKCDQVHAPMNPFKQHECYPFVTAGYSVAPGYEALPSGPTPSCGAPPPGFPPPGHGAPPTYYGAPPPCYGAPPPGYGAPPA